MLNSHRADHLIQSVVLMEPRELSSQSGFVNQHQCYADSIYWLTMHY